MELRAHNLSIEMSNYIFARIVSYSLNIADDITTCQVKFHDLLCQMLPLNQEKYHQTSKT